MVIVRSWRLGEMEDVGQMEQSYSYARLIMRSNLQYGDYG